MRFISEKSRQMPPLTGMGLPSRLVPAHQGVTAYPFRAASLTAPTTPSVFWGQTTTSGRQGAWYDSSREWRSRLDSPVETWLSPIVRFRYATSSWITRGYLMIGLREIVRGADRPLHHSMPCSFIALRAPAS